MLEGTKTSTIQNQRAAGELGELNPTTVRRNFFKMMSYNSHQVVKKRDD